MLQDMLEILYPGKSDHKAAKKTAFGERELLWTFAG
jgi:hypothetical protein